MPSEKVGPKLHTLFTSHKIPVRLKLPVGLKLEGT